MLVAIINVSDTKDILTKINENQARVDVFELRLDYLSSLSLPRLTEIRHEITCPLIFTLRPQNQGGRFSGREESRLEKLNALAKLLPDYLDIESHVPETFITQLHQQYPSIKIIRSIHYTDHTPRDLGAVFQKIQHPDVFHYKIITYANTTLDSLFVLHFLKSHAAKKRLTAHCMGPLGVPSRIIGTILGNQFTYGCLDDRNTPASACPTLQALLKAYRIQSLNKETKVCALLGDPVEHSQGHLFHNHHYALKGHNAVYVKLKLLPTELNRFFELIKGLPFYGFSITMPLKERILPFIHRFNVSADDGIKAINTLKIDRQQIIAHNTDGLGAIETIAPHTSIKNSHVLIIGAGGSAKPIAYAIHQQHPASLTLLNRTFSKAATLAQRTNSIPYDFISFKNRNSKKYNIVINTLPSFRECDAQVLSLVSNAISADTFFMSLDYLSNSLANKLPCHFINGQKMFESQALRQIAFWFD
jgi:3-dehydroquinate dehydratase/shikimate dehydrogenase